MSEPQPYIPIDKKLLPEPLPRLPQPPAYEEPARILDDLLWPAPPLAPDDVPTDQDSDESAQS